MDEQFGSVEHLAESAAESPAGRGEGASADHPEHEAVGLGSDPATDLETEVEPESEPRPEPRPEAELRTGDQRVDDVLDSLTPLDELSVDEHLPIFEQAHEALRSALDAQPTPDPEAQPPSDASEDD
jgi:hypothetical protein